MGNATVITVCVFVAFGGVLFGYDTGTISGILAMDKWLQDFGTFDSSKNNYSITSNQTSLIVSILSVGTFFGALAGAPFAESLGRKWGLIAANGVFAIGVVLQTIASGSIPLFIIGRVIAGAGVGLISMMVPLYQSEAAPKHIRGALISCYQLAITIGIFLAAVVNEGTHNRSDTGAYRIPIALQLLWSLILTTGMFFLPESPRYLVKKGDIAGAEISMARLRGISDPKNSSIQTELAEIKANLDYELSLGSTTYADCFKGTNAKRTWIGILIQMFQQLTGVNFIFYYGTTFFQSSGITNAFVINVIVNLVNVFSTIPGLLSIERFGRRALLLYGALIMFVSQFIIAIVGVSTNSIAASKVLIAFECLFIFGFASSWGPCAWVIPGEIMPLKIRGKAMSLATASNWFWNFILAYTTPYMVGKEYGNLGTKIGFVWGSTNVLCFLYVYFFVYETKGLALEETDELFETCKPTNSAKFVPKVRYMEKENVVVDENNSTKL